MNVLLFVQPGLYGEALEALVRELDPALQVQCLVGMVGDRLPEIPPGSPELVIFEFDTLGPGAAECLAAARAAAPDAFAVVVNAPDNAAECFGGTVRALPKHASGEDIGASIQEVLADRTLAEADITDGSVGVITPGELQPEAVPTLQGFGLTPTEIQVMAIMAEGRTNPEIAQILGKALGTVRTQVQSILRKLQVRNRQEAIRVATRVVAVVNSQIGDLDRKGLDIAGLLPHMRHRLIKQGTVLFRKGDESRHLFLVQRGRVRLEEFNATLGQNDTLGEIGIFAPDHRRTCTAVCESDVALFEIDAEKVRQAYFLNPQFALHIINKITSRLIADKVRAA